jgi:hypothetical protein
MPRKSASRIDAKQLACGEGRFDGFLQTDKVEMFSGNQLLDLGAAARSAKPTDIVEPNMH